MDLEIANGHGECVICFEPLFNKQPCVFMINHTYKEGFFSSSKTILKRMCRHFVCMRCGNDLVPKKCPVCRREFESLTNFPIRPTDNPSQWFDLVDYDNNGTIDKRELTEALKAVLPVDEYMLQEAIEFQWPQFDTNRDGAMSKEEFNIHFIPWISTVISNLQQRMAYAIPDLQLDPLKWFSFWDHDNNGSLNRSEIVRAIIKSVNGLTGADEDWLDNVFSVIWCMIDPNGDGEISKSEFLLPNGLHETLIANIGR